jgi:hypothetical protein
MTTVTEPAAPTHTVRWVERAVLVPSRFADDEMNSAHRRDVHGVTIE